MGCFTDENGYLLMFGLIFACIQFVCAPCIANRWWFFYLVCPAIGSVIYFVLMVYSPSNFTGDPERMITWILAFTGILWICIFILAERFATFLALAVGICVMLIPVYQNGSVLGNWLHMNVSASLTAITGLILILVICAAVVSILYYSGVVTVACTMLGHFTRVLIACVVVVFFIDVAYLERDGDRELCYGDAENDTPDRSPLSMDRPLVFCLLLLLFAVLSVMTYQCQTEGALDGRIRCRPGECCCRRRPTRMRRPPPRRSTKKKTLPKHDVEAVPPPNKTTYTYVSDSSDDEE